MALVPYLDQDDLSEPDRELLVRPINLVRALAHSPGGLRAFSQLGDWVRHAANLDPRLRELATVQVGYLTGSAYEFSHHVLIGHNVGVTDADVAALIAATEDPEGAAGDLSQLDQLVLRAAREMTTTTTMNASTWTALALTFPIPTLVELVIVIAYYNAVVRVLATLAIDVESAYDQVLSTFPVPDPR